MADFTHWGEAVAQGVGWPPGTFVKAYRAIVRQRVSYAGRIASAQALLELAKYHGAWKGTPTQFLELIGEWTGYAAVTTPGWPKTPARASVEPRRIAAQLRIFGLSVTFERGSHGERLVNFVPNVADGRRRRRWGSGGPVKSWN